MDCGTSVPLCPRRSKLRPPKKSGSALPQSKKFRNLPVFQLLWGRTVAALLRSWTRQSPPSNRAPKTTTKYAKGTKVEPDLRAGSQFSPPSPA
jgi:hypothetical protein